MTNKEVQNITLESLRDWFKKEKWVRISSSGNIAGDCGTSKNKKNPDRCLPKAKAQSLSKAERAATARKKKKAGSKGKTVVKNTKKATVKKEGLWANINAKKKAGKKSSHKNSNAYKDAKKAGNALKQENDDRSFTKDDMKEYIYDTIGGYLERYLGYNPGPSDHPIYKMNEEQFAAWMAQKFIEGIDELLDETDATIEMIREAVEEVYEDYKKISMGVGHDPDMHFEQDQEAIGRDALEMVLQTLDKMATPTKLETANPQDGKAAPYGSGYKPIKKMKETKEAPAGHYFTKSGNLVKGTMSADAKERGARKSDPKDKQRSKVPKATQYSEMTKEDLRNLIVGTIAEMQQNENLLQEDDRCTRLAKSKYDTWPSAYASGAVVRCRRGEIWKKK